MGRRILECVVFGVVGSFVILAAMAGRTIAATTHTKESVPVAVSIKSAKQESRQGHNPPIQRIKKKSVPTDTERQPDDIQKQAKSVPTEFKPERSKHSRRMNIHKRVLPKAVVQPRADLMYYGMLESPQRYDPRRNHLGGSVPNPDILELTHDHFQELDRNQDGTIDPVERTFGRPDMDRDLHDCQPR
ncbi:MAG: hypothetical protein L0H94_14925 [Nitrospira sp.]|nr:hypothetical protein [Nitrospira sp.]